MPLLRTFDSRKESIEAIARTVRGLTRFDVLEAESGPAAVTVRDIIAGIRSRGDDALCELIQRFDRAEITPEGLRVPAERLERAARDLDPGLREAIGRAIEHVRTFQEQILPPAPPPVGRDGVKIELRTWPLRRVGVYVPAGSAPLPSTVVHCVVPAQVAGVKEIVVASPPRGGEVDATILATAHLLGVDEVYRAGGAQAIAAMAIGTETIRRVDKIVGPGNIYAQLAKKMLYGVVDIDGFAGPSEVLVIADDSAEPAFVAADLLAQAEHDPGQAVLVTTDAAMIGRVEEALEQHLANLATAEGARRCLTAFAAAVVVRDRAEAAAFADAYAPEHLQVETAEPEDLAGRIASAGAVFLGHWTPESFGDYVAGPSHVLPTGGTARAFSGLSVYDFQRRAAWMRYEPAGLRNEAAATVRIAEAEGLAAHALAVKVRAQAAAK